MTRDTYYRDALADEIAVAIRDFLTGIEAAPRQATKTCGRMMLRGLAERDRTERHFDKPAHGDLLWCAPAASQHRHGFVTSGRK